MKEKIIYMDDYYIIKDRYFKYKSDAIKYSYYLHHEIPTSLKSIKQEKRELRRKKLERIFNS